MSCSRCFEDWLCKCLAYDSTITVNAILPVGNYTVVFTNHFGQKYSAAVSVYDQGSFELNVNDFPEGFFYSGDLKMEIQDTRCKPVNFKMAQEYDCVDISVVGGTHEKNTIGCEFSCVPGALQSALIPFTEVATVTIPWATYLANYGNNPVVQVYHETSPDVYQLVDVSIEQIFVDGVLDEININNAGVATGYVIVS